MPNEMIGLPPQQIPYSQKTKAWRKKCVDWANSKTFFNFSPVRKTVIHKKINYDLMNGKIHMQDLELILNPNNVVANFTPDKIQHYPIINSKIQTLIGEELKRPFDYRVIVTNPTQISQIEENKKAQITQALEQLIKEDSGSDDEFQAKLQKMSDYFTYEWQDMREIRANALLNHYNKEYNFPLLFNNGFMDALTVAEEIYHCDIQGGELIIERVNPLKIRAFRQGYSSKFYQE